MAPIWKGALTFGLVNIPVRMQTAVRSEKLSFRMLYEKDLSPVKYQRVSETHPEPIPWDDIVKGYEYEKGQFVVLAPEDFEKAAIASSRTIDILDFVKVDDVDSRYFETPYFLVPEKNGEKAYALLREAIQESGTLGIGKVTLRTRQHLAGVKTVGDAIVLELMRFENELVDPAEYNFPKDQEIRPQELKMARQLIDSLTVGFEPEKYTDEYRENMMKIIRGKMKGKTVRIEEPGVAEPTGVIDLMARLQESLEQGRAGQRRESGSGKSRSKSGGKGGDAKKSAAKKGNGRKRSSGKSKQAG
jgi:DNA end-binding protein Ku